MIVFTKTKVSIFGEYGAKKTETIQNRAKKNPKAILLIDSRQTGEITLLKELIENQEEAVIFDGDDPKTIDLLATVGAETLARIIGDKQNSICR